MPRDAEKCVHHDQLEEKVDWLCESNRRIEQRLAGGDTHFATQGLRIDHLEKVLYGTLALVVAAVIAGAVQVLRGAV